jgi:hypothetical protein
LSLADVATLTLTEAPNGGMQNVVQDNSVVNAGENNTPAPAPAVQDNNPEVLTFAQLKELIEQGRTDEIPNNKHIPDVISVSRRLSSSH